MKGGVNEMREAVIVAGARTPVGKAKKGTLAQYVQMTWVHWL